MRAQIAVAAGERLRWSQADLAQRGHAIEARVYAEDPMNADLPQAGPLLLYREPVMPGVRVDAGVTEGGEVSVHYDPMIAKVIASGETRDAARRRLIAALRSFPILGVRTNVAFLIALLEHPRFIRGDLDTRVVDAERDALVSAIASEPPPAALAVAAIGDRASAPGPASIAAAPDPWETLRSWRG